MPRGFLTKNVVFFQHNVPSEESTIHRFVQLWRSSEIRSAREISLVESLKYILIKSWPRKYTVPCDILVTPIWRNLKKFEWHGGKQQYLCRYRICKLKLMISHLSEQNYNDSGWNLRIIVITAAIHSSMFSKNTFEFSIIFYFFFKSSTVLGEELFFFIIFFKSYIKVNSLQLQYPDISIENKIVAYYRQVFFINHWSDSFSKLSFSSQREGPNFL